ncbi:hypothetical protein [Tuberibacillus calidus]|uniref:hypothetical protein n=1 Tax=Tuberibacillus calidus TaxID=340097 RepID=UPI00040732CC|nr:hypothetical protein [Tuberibacillus calidus]
MWYFLLAVLFIYVACMVLFHLIGAILHIVASPFFWFIIILLAILFYFSHY